MIKSIKLTLLLFICTGSLAQEQMNNWYMAPHKINMTTPDPNLPANNSAITAVIGTATTATAFQSANGFYDNNGTGELIFYVADDGVYDYNNTLLGTIPQGGTEIAIVPFGTNSIPNTPPCQRKFNIFTTKGGIGSVQGVSLYQSILDMGSLSVTTTQIDFMPFDSEFGAIAVGKSSANGSRFLYFLVGSGEGSATGQINKLVINNDGTVGASTPIYPTASLPNDYPGIEVFARELDLSRDGKWLAWASYLTSSLSPTLAKYHLLALDNITGDADFATYNIAAYQQFNIAAATDNYFSPGFRGVEFYQSGSTTRLFMGAGLNGIYYNNVSIPFTNSPVFVNNSNGASTPTTTYGLSQIELAHSLNGYMYASSGNSLINIGAFNPADPSPTILASPHSFFIPNPPIANYAVQVLGNTVTSKLYTLPDQIDGQNYGLITPSALLVPLVTCTIASFPSGGGSGQSATWTYGSNPVNNATSPIHIINELRIKQNSTVTIKGMTFKFSPEAKVIIEVGSTLILDEDGVGNPTVLSGNSVSDPCFIPYTWKGVEIWGNSALSQIPTASGNFNQGRLVMKNRSSIEYAEWGARTWRPLNSIPPTGYATTGGIVEVKSGSFFKNCSVGVEFKPYKNIVGNILRANRSILIDAEFINTNSPYPYPFVKAPIHVLAESCNSIRITNCRFLNDNSLFMFQKGSFGVRSFNSSFTIINSKFHNLNIESTPKSI